MALTMSYEPLNGVMYVSQWLMALTMIMFFIKTHGMLQSTWFLIMTHDYHYSTYVLPWFHYGS